MNKSEFLAQYNDKWLSKRSTILRYFDQANNDRKLSNFVRSIDSEHLPSSQWFVVLAHLIEANTKEAVSYWHGIQSAFVTGPTMDDYMSGYGTPLARDYGNYVLTDKDLFIALKSLSKRTDKESKKAFKNFLKAAKQKGNSFINEPIEEFISRQRYILFLAMLRCHRVGKYLSLDDRYPSEDYLIKTREDHDFASSLGLSESTIPLEDHISAQNFDAYISDDANKFNNDHEFQRDDSFTNVIYAAKPYSFVKRKISLFNLTFNQENYSYDQIYTLAISYLLKRLEIEEKIYYFTANPAGVSLEDVALVANLKNTRTIRNEFFKDNCILKYADEKKSMLTNSSVKEWLNLPERKMIDPSFVSIDEIDLFEFIKNKQLKDYKYSKDYIDKSSFAEQMMIL